MKILSNFDTKKCEKLQLEKIMQYGEECVIVIRHSFYYWLFRGCTRFMALSVFFFWLWAWITLYFPSGYIYTLFTLMYILLLWFLVIKIYITYIMDFILVTPDSVYTHEQKGLLFSNFKEIPTMNIRSVEVMKNSILWNIFGYGDISLSSDIENTLEWKQESAGVIFFSYVDDVYKVSKDIMAVGHHDNNLSG